MINKQLSSNIKSEVKTLMYLLYLCDVGVELSNQDVLLTTAIGPLNSVGRRAIIAGKTLPLVTK